MIGLVVALLLAAPPAATLEEAKRQGDPLRRFEMALEAAATRMAEARQLVKTSGSRAELDAAVGEVAAAAELSLESLRATGRRPGKLGRQYKQGEVKTRQMVRELGEMAQALSVDDRVAAEKARDAVAVIHEEFLLGVMSK